jgi:hypothetical protein
VDIVIKLREMIIVSPNERYTVPDEIGRQLVARGKAEEIKPDIIEQEIKPNIVEQEKKVTKRGKE